MSRTTSIRLVAPLTQTSTVYDRVREDLLSGRLKPGHKLPMRFLMDTYQTGQTPLREALNRLTAEGLVESRDQRGFYVTGVSRPELEELTRTRCWVETLALREAMAAATAEWEEALLVAHHRLKRTPRSLSPERFEDNPEWEKLHRIFHRSLISQCSSRPLVTFCDQLADQLYRYRRLSIVKAYPSRRVADEHQAILDAVLGRDADQATSLLAAHFTATAEVLLEDRAVFPETSLTIAPPGDDQSGVPRFPSDGNAS